LGSSLFARHYSGSRGFFPFLRVLRCFSSPACLSLPYVFRQEYTRITTRRFPHSEILGSTDGQLLPEAYRSRPRPSSALGAKASTVCPFSLDRKEHVMCCRYGVFKVHVGSSAQRAGQTAGLSKLNSVVSRKATAPGQNPRARSRAVIRRCVEVDVVLGESAVRTVSRPSTGRTPSGVRAPVFPRKEVIQPQLPLRLPCYDFTPIIDPTFDGCLPEGLAHRLRVLPTFVV
jgi:hypothetical protein